MVCIYWSSQILERSEKKGSMSIQNIQKFVETLKNTVITDILSISDPNVALDNFINQFKRNI